MNSQTLVVDLQNVAYRLYCGRAPQFSSATGAPVHAVLGTIEWILGAQRRIDARRIVVVDDSRCSYRHALYPRYKEGREPRPSDYFAQVALIHKYAAAAGWAVLRREGWEADDLIATVVGLAPCSAIMSSDKDLRQLLGPTVCAIMREPSGYVVTGSAEAEQKFGVPVQRIAEYLAIVGDDSDNIPGVRGAGPKLAQRLINEFGGFEAALRKADAFSPSIRAKLCDGATSYELSLKLTQLRRSPDITLSDIESKVCDAGAITALDAQHGLRIARHFSPLLINQMHLFS